MSPFHISSLLLSKRKCEFDQIHFHVFILLILTHWSPETTFNQKEWHMSLLFLLVDLFYLVFESMGVRRKITTSLGLCWQVKMNFEMESGFQPKLSKGLQSFIPFPYSLGFKSIFDSLLNLPLLTKPI